MKTNYTGRYTRKPRTRKAMIEYLSGHFRYDTMKSWNRVTSYAVNIKVHHLEGLDHLTRERCYGMLEVEEVFQELTFILAEFDRRHDYEWQIRRNARSGGYLVLYQGGRRPSPYKSFCEVCGQGNCRPATDEDAKVSILFPHLSLLAPLGYVGGNEKSTQATEESAAQPC